MSLFCLCYLIDLIYIEVPMEVFEKGEKNKPIIKAVPIAILKPLIGLTTAASKIQQGFLNKYDKNDCN